MVVLFLILRIRVVVVPGPQSQLRTPLCTSSPAFVITGSSLGAGGSHSPRQEHRGWDFGNRQMAFSSDQRIGSGFGHQHGDVQQAAECTHPQPRREARAGTPILELGQTGCMGSDGLPGKDM